MNKQTTPSDKEIIECLNTDFAINASALESLPWGADINACLYKAQTSDQLYFVKLKMGHELSAALAKLLHNAGIAEVIAPVNAIQKNSVVKLNDFTVTVYPFIEGKNGFEQHLNDAQWIMLGKALRKIHEINIPLSIQTQIRKESYSSKFREVIQSLYTQLDDIQTQDEIGLNLLTILKEKQTRILEMVNRAEQLSKELQKQNLTLVLCHSDIHAGNVLIDNKDKLYIVDWDEPIMAPIERDLMFIGAGVANVWNKPNEEKLFYQGYGKADINKESLAYYRYERIVEDIVEYAQALLLSAQGGESRKVMFKHFMDMFETNGVIDIAFKTS